MSEFIDPKQFIISRKRKKYKFAKFANSPLCFELDEWHRTKLDVIEVGAGTGLFSVELAAAYPEKQYLAVDVKADRLQKGAYEAEARGLTNIRFVRARGDQLAELVEPSCLEQLWVTFPDPFPKKRSAGRRLTHPTFLKIYAHLLSERGKLYFKTDARELFLWSLEQLVQQHWTIDELAFDLHESELSTDYKYLTTYETRWLSEGIVTNFVRAGAPSRR